MKAYRHIALLLLLIAVLVLVATSSVCLGVYVDTAGNVTFRQPKGVR